MGEETSRRLHTTHRIEGMGRIGVFGMNHSIARRTRVCNTACSNICGSRLGWVQPDTSPTTSPVCMGLNKESSIKSQVEASYVERKVMLHSTGSAKIVVRILLNNSVLLIWISLLRLSSIADVFCYGAARWFLPEPFSGSAIPSENELDSKRSLWETREPGHSRHRIYALI